MTATVVTPEPEHHLHTPGGPGPDQKTMKSTSILPPSLPALQHCRNDMSRWLREVKHRYLDYRMDCALWVQKTGGEQLIRYPDGTEILIARQTDPKLPEWRATVFRHGRLESKAHHEYPCEALADTLDANREHGQATIYAYTNQAETALAA